MKRRRGASWIFMEGQSVNCSDGKLNCNVHFGAPAGQRRPKLRRSAGFQTCCIADIQIGSTARIVTVWIGAGWKHCDTAGLETCATGALQSPCAFGEDGSDLAAEI